MHDGQARGVEQVSAVQPLVGVAADREQRSHQRHAVEARQRGGGRRARRPRDAQRLTAAAHDPFAVVLQAHAHVVEVVLELGRHDPVVRDQSDVPAKHTLAVGLARHGPQDSTGPAGMMRA